MLVSALVAGCGVEEAASGDMRVVVPFHAAGQVVACSQPLVGLGARLWIGGYLTRPCLLSVDPSSYEASGTCRSITTGRVRPLMIEYFVPVGGDDRQLAYNIGYIDLRREGLASGQTTARAVLDGVASRIVYREDELPELESGPSGGDLGEAEVWATARRSGMAGDDGPIELEQMSLECDDDGCSNLEEACGGSLDCTTANSTCP